ncbi:MAG: hypothetical protein ACJ79K_14275 [Gemmatimonadaceae bacterium]
MNDTLHATLARWADYYLITGTAAAALTGLQFVVQTLLTSDALRPITGGDAEDGVGAFGSPTVVHFTLALIISAALCVPWPGDGGLRWTLGTLGVGALVYSLIVLRRARRQRSYVPVLEDWIWHAILPAVAYLAVVVAAVRFERDGADSLLGVAAATMLLLCIGIHNAWDTVTYLTARALSHDAPTVQPSPQGNRGARHRRKHR